MWDVWSTRSAQVSTAARKAGLEKHEHWQTLHSPLSINAGGIELSVLIEPHSYCCPFFLLGLMRSM